MGRWARAAGHGLFLWRVRGSPRRRPSHRQRCGPYRRSSRSRWPRPRRRVERARRRRRRNHRRTCGRPRCRRGAARAMRRATRRGRRSRRCWQNCPYRRTSRVRRAIGWSSGGRGSNVCTRSSGRRRGPSWVSWSRSRVRMRRWATRCGRRWRAPASRWRTTARGATWSSCGGSAVPADVCVRGSVALCDHRVRRHGVADPLRAWLTAHPGVKALDWVALKLPVFDVDEVDWRRQPRVLHVHDDRAVTVCEFDGERSTAGTATGSKAAYSVTADTSTR
jgi:hypothetical protein